LHFVAWRSDQYIIEFKNFQVKPRTILELPSAQYMKTLAPGRNGIPASWERTNAHAELLMDFFYQDYLKASGLNLSKINPSSFVVTFFRRIKSIK